MGFLKTIRDSIYSPEFYTSIPQKRLLSAIGYFLLLSLFLTIIQSVVPIWKFSTTGQAEIKKFVNKVTNIYPSELEIKIQKGKASTNVQEPYFIPLQFDTDKVGNISNLIVIDTKTPYSSDQFNQYETYAWLTEDSVFIRNNNKIEANDLSKVSNITINRAFVTSLINKFTPWLKFITPLAITGILIGIYIAYSSRLIYLFFLALIIWVLAKFLKKPLSYGGSYKMGLYAMTLGLFVNLILSFFKFPGFPFMLTIISIGVVLINLSKVEKTETQPVSIPTAQPQQPENLPVSQQETKPTI